MENGPDKYPEANILEKKEGTVSLNMFYEKHKH